MLQPRALPSTLRGVDASPTAAPLDRTLAPLTRWAFYAWMFSLPFDVVTPMWLPRVLQNNLSIPRMVGALLILCFLIDPKSRPWRLPPATWAFVAFFGIFTLSMLRSNFTDVIGVLQQLQLILLFLICYNLFLTKRMFRGAPFSFAIACGVAAIMLLTGFVEETLSEAETGGREFAFGTDPNLYGKLIAVGAIVAIGIAHIRRDKRIASLPVLWGIVVVCLILIAKTGSRGTTLALGTGLATFLLRKGSLMVRLRNIALLIVAAGLGLWILGRSEMLVGRWAKAIEEGSTSGRDIIFLEALRMTRDKPVFGWGAAATHVLADRLFVKGEVRATHNMVLAILIYTGLMGFIPFMVAYLKVAWACWRARTGTENILPLAILATLFVADMITGGMPGKLHWTFFAYMLAAGQSVKMTSSRILSPNRVSRA